MPTCTCLRRFETNKGLLIHKRKKHGLRTTRPRIKQSGIYFIPDSHRDSGLPLWDIPINFDLRMELNVHKK